MTTTILRYPYRYSKQLVKYCITIKGKQHYQSTKHLLRYIILSFCAIYSLNIPANAAIPKVDLNGDSLADVFLYNIFTGDISGWLIENSSTIENVSYSGIAPITGWTPIGLSDFNGDGRTDILLYNTNNGELSIWFINGSQVLGYASLGTMPPDSGWTPIGLSDFNGDGRTDVLWRNGFNGELGVWLINGSQVLEYASLGAVPPDSGWAPIGLSDFNGDGRIDVLWRNRFSGELGIWLINGSQIFQYASLGVVPPDSGWIPIGSDDFNGDGRTDILWRNTFTDDVVAWLMNGTTYQDQPYQKVPPSSMWQIRIPQ